MHRSLRPNKKKKSDFDLIHVAGPTSVTGMRAPNLRKVSGPGLSDARYAQSFTRFMHHSAAATAASTARLAQLINERHTEGHSDRHRPVTLLDIGAGTGETALGHLLPLLNMDISNHAYEPNPILASLVEGCLMRLSGDSQQCKPGLVLREAFTPQTRLLPVWDIILLCHSLYGHQLLDNTAVVRTAAAGLRPGGMLLVVHREGGSAEQLRAALTAAASVASGQQQACASDDLHSGYNTQNTPGSGSGDSGGSDGRGDGVVGTSSCDSGFLLSALCLDTCILAAPLMEDDDELDEVLSLYHGADLQLMPPADRAAARQDFHSACRRGDDGGGWVFPTPTCLLVLTRPPSPGGGPRRSNGLGDPCLLLQLQKELSECGSSESEDCSDTEPVLLMPGQDEFRSALQKMKDPAAKQRAPAAIARPRTVTQLRLCVAWAATHGIPFSVIGGSHSDHCTWDGALAISMERFASVEVHPSTRRLTVGGGAKMGAVVAAAEAHGLMLPLGARPSVGVGLVLQGGLGHLSRLHGLAVDRVVAMEWVDCVHGRVHRAGRESAGEHTGTLWALLGAAPNFGIVVKVRGVYRGGVERWRGGVGIMMRG